MKILKIEGANIASLAEPFSIDLTEDPLRSAGLFAITGETGAGKSSILDAMCLALYGDCPRLSAEGVNDDVPEIEGDPIKSKDPRSILRRGASHGYAIVEFEGSDGKSYQAYWGARRARGKIDGRLQNVERHIKRLEDEIVLESQIMSVRDKVVELTGLQYEEFRRTVLLAQGDFDAFLKAGSTERAALLEKVTGTSLYREISKRVFDLCAKSKADLDLLEVRRGEQNALSEDVREGLLEEQGKLQSRLAKLAIDEKSISSKIALHKALSDAQSRLNAAATRLETAQNASLAAGPDRVMKQRIERAMSLRSAFDALAEADRLAKELDGRLTKAKADEQSSLDALNRAKADRDAAVKSASEADDLFKSLGPDWSRATTLDGQIVSAQREVTEAIRIHSEKLAQEKISEKAVEDCTNERNTALKKIETCATSLEQRPGVGQLVQVITQVKKAISDRREARRKMSETIRQRDDAIRQAELKTQEIEAHRKSYMADRDRMQQITHEQGDLKTRAQEIAQHEPQDRLVRLQAGQAAVKSMQSQARTALVLSERLREAREAAGRAQKEKQDAIALEAKAKPAIEKLKSEIDALLRPLDLAEAAASDVAQSLRARLQEGEPCPVCGSCDHPDHAGSALAGLVAQMRKDLSDKRLELAGLETSLADALRAIDRTTGLKTAADEDANRIAADLKQARDDFASSKLEAEKTGLKSLPDDPLTAQDMLSGLLAKIELRRQELDALAREEAVLAKKMSALQEEQAKLQKAVDDRIPLKEKLTSEISSENSKRDVAAERLIGLEAQLSETEAMLTLYLGGVGLSIVLLDQNPDQTLAEIDRLQTWWTTQTASLQGAEKDAEERGRALSGLTEKLNAARGAVNEAGLARQARESALEELRKERSGLLGGEPTEQHRTRHNNLRIEAGRAKEAAERLVSDLNGAHEGAKARTSGLDADLLKAKSRHAERNAEFEMACIARELSPDDIPGLLEDAETRAGQLALALKAIDDELVSAKSAMSSRQQDLEDQKAKGVPDETEEDLVTELSTIETEQQTLQERKGEIAQSILADNAILETIKGLDAEIKSAKALYDTWMAVNDAVGSRSGGKFAQIAQTVTLSILVERANLYLADLKPRYQLAQGGDDLSLKIIDRDMGDEMRSTRSLSGGERFLVSLALALALSRMGSHGGLAATLFIDEGFGSLDAQSLDMAIDALEALQSQGRTVGVISHVDALKDRIPVQVRVERRGPGSSVVELAA